jgi:DNA-binding NarL/FixJ family response regulator
MVNTLIQLRGTVEALNIAQLETQKGQLMALIDSMSSYVPNCSSPAPVAAPAHPRLSPREGEVLSMILAGRRLKEIAATLDISVKTVTTHRSRLLKKLGLDDNLGLFRYGVRNGMISV